MRTLTLLTVALLLLAGCEKTIHEARVPAATPPLACAMP
jgi:hypothetical protein